MNNVLCKSKGVADVRKSKKSGRKQPQLRVACYTRFSTAYPADLMEVQMKHFLDEISENPAWELAGFFADEGISGTSMKNREDFMQMLQACEEGRVDLILTKSVSRFGRNVLDVIETVSHLNKLGVGVIFEKEQLDTRTADISRFSLPDKIAQPAFN